MEILNIQQWLENGLGGGAGSGSGAGAGDYDGGGYGCGGCPGDYDGSGAGYGFGAGSGYGYGAGSGAGYGFGSGYGYGAGAGDGDGSGSGAGDGYGYGDGDGDGYGDGYGDGDGAYIKFFCGSPVFIIDRIPTIITAVFGSYAKGYILEQCLTLTPCYIAKQESHFAHGKTLSEAVSTVAEKAFEDMPEGDRIAEFWKCHENGVKYPARDLYDWHHRLTGSCEMGRNTFAAEHGIDLNSDMFSVAEFVELCGESYGGEIIRKLEEVEK